MPIFNIRKSAFETNSSSVHALCINNNSESIKVPKSYTFYHGGEFGWSREVYKTDYPKGQYLYLILNAIIEDTVKDEYESLPEIQKYMKENPKPYYYWNEKEFPDYKKMCEEKKNEFKSRINDILVSYGCTDVTWEEESEFKKSYLDEGYIDHVDDAYDFFRDMLNNPELLINFLFGDSSIYTSNDNDGEDASDYTDPNGWDYYYIKGN